MGTAIVETPSGEEITVTYEGQKTEEEILQLASEQIRLRALETLLGRDDEVAEDKVPAVITPERKPATVRDEVAGAMARPFIGALGLGQDIVNLSYQNMGVLGDALGIEDDDKLVSDELVNKLKRKVADGVASVASADQRFFRPGVSEDIRAIKNKEVFAYNKTPSGEDIPPIQSESFLTEEGAIRTPETLEGVTATVGTYIATGGPIRSAARAWASSLSRGTPLFRDVLAGASTLALTENLMYTGNPAGETISGAFSDLEEQELIQLGENVQDLVDFFSIDEADDELEQRLKLTLEGFAVSGALEFVLTTVGVGASAIKNLVNKDPKTQAKLTMEYLAEAKENLVLSSSNTHRPIVNELLYGKGVGQETAEGLAQVESQRAGFSKFVSKWLTSRGYFTPVAFNAVRQKEYATRQLIKEAENISGRLETALSNVADKTILTFDRQKIKANQQQYRDKVKEALTGKVTFKKGDTIEEQARQLGLPVEVARPVIEARELIDKLSNRLINSSIPDEALRQVILDNTGKYLNRSYRLFEDTGFKPSESSTQYVVNQLQKLKIKGGMDPDEAYEAARTEVDDLLLSLKENRGGFIQSWGALTKETKNILLGRKKLTPELREFLGEIENPSENVVLTVSRMARLLENNKFNSKMYDIAGGKYIFDRRKAGYDYKLNIPGSVLHEKFTTREVGLALEGRQDDFAMFLEGRKGKFFGPETARALRLWGAAKGQTQKAVTVYRPATQLRNIYGAAEVALATGVPPWRVSDGLKLIYNNLKTGGDAETDKIYEELLGLGVVNTNLRVNEFRKLIQAIGKIDQDKITKDGVINTLAKAGKPFEDAYVAGDDYFKMNAYFYELDVLKKAYPNESLEVLKEQAALKVRNGLPNYDLISPGTKDLRYSFMGNFPAFASEIVRTGLHNVKMASQELTSGNAVMARRGAQRLAFYIAVPTAWEIGSEASARLVGFNEEEEEAAKVLTRTPWSQASRIYSVKDGELHYTDIRFIDAKNTLKEPVQRFYNEIVSGELKGRELDQVLEEATKEALVALAAPYAEKSILTEAITDIVGAISTGGRTPSGERLYDADDDFVYKLSQGVLHLLNSFNPGIFDSGFKITRAAIVDEDLNTREPFGYEKYNFDLELRRAMGLTQTPFRPDQALYYQVMDYKRKSGRRRKQTPTFGVDMEETVKDLERNMQAEYKDQQDLFEVVNAARVFLGTAGVERVLKEANIPIAQREALYENRAYFYEYFDKNEYEMARKHPNMEEDTFIELRNQILGMENAFNHTRLMKLPEDAKYFQSPDPRFGGPVPNLEFDELREDMAKGGEVYNVPRVPVEPDERIDKMTGRPYNEQAGEAFIDEEDRMGFVAGGSAIAKKIAKFLAEDVAEEAAPKTKQKLIDNFDYPPNENSANTQRVNTVPSYEKAAKILDELSDGDRGLDFSSGLGLGADAMNQISKKTRFETYEPFAKDNVRKPTYQSIDQVPKNAYDKLTNLNTLNVVPKNIRDQIVKDIGDALAPDGVAIISARGKEVIKVSPKNKVKDGPEANSVVVIGNDKKPAYQKGFTQSELTAYVREILGSGFEVNPLPAKDKVGPVSVVIKKVAVRGKLNQGGLYGSISGLMEKAAREFFGVSTKDLRANEREAAELVNSLVAAGKLPEREKVTYEDGRVLSGDVFNAANHMFLANIAKDSEVKRLALQGKEYIQQATGDTGPHGAIGDRKNNSLGFEFYDMAKGNPKIFRQLVSENLIDRFGQAEGGLTRRLTAQAGGLQFTSTRKNEVPLGPKYNDAGERLYYWVPSLEGANTFASTGTNDDRYRRLFGNQSRGGYFTEAEIRQAFDADKGMTTLSSQVDWDQYWGYLTERQDLIDAGELKTGLDAFVDGRQTKMQFIEDAGGLRAAGGAKEAGQGLRALQTDAYRASYADIVYGDTQQALMEKYGLPQTLQLDDGSLYEFNGSSFTKTFAPDKQSLGEKVVDKTVGAVIQAALPFPFDSAVNKFRPTIGESGNQQTPDLGADIRPEPFTPNVESTELDPSTITSEGSETKPFPNLENIVSGAGSTPDTKQQITPRGTLPSSQEGRMGRSKGGKVDKKKMACNKPKRTPKHPKKSHIVKACEGGKEKIIRFGQQGAKTAGKPKAGESKRMKAKRKSFKARHGRNIRKGKMSAAYWANKVKW